MSYEEETGAQARFFAAMHDDLRAPLRAILGLSERLAGGVVPDARQQAEYAGQIHANARQLLQLVNNLVELARANSGQIELSRQPADLAALVADAVRLVQPAAASRGIEIAADLADAPLRVNLDAPRILHALHGLLTGALHLAGEGKKIALRIAPEAEDRVRLEVTGLNIGPGHTGEFVIPSPGAWLGLALARGIVEAHGGHIGVGGAPGQRRVLHAVLPGVVRG
jgi:signal transduction histidine kinase